MRGVDDAARRGLLQPMPHHHAAIALEQEIAEGQRGGSRRRAGADRVAEPNELVESPRTEPAPARRPKRGRRNAIKISSGLPRVFQEAQLPRIGPSDEGLDFAPIVRIAMTSDLVLHARQSS